MENSKATAKFLLQTALEGSPKPLNFGDPSCGIFL